MKPTFLAVDFFCGAGGMTRGLLDAGGYVIAGTDKDPICRQTFVSNNRNAIDSTSVRYLQYDIFMKKSDYPTGQQYQLRAELDDLVAHYRNEIKDVPLLFSICAPCQPFTRLSHKKLSDERKIGRKRDAGLLRESIKMIRRYEPELIISENVSGIDSPKYGGVWENYRNELLNLGYAIGSKIVCASKFGIPQYRKRSILIAARKNIVRRDRFADLLTWELLVPDFDPNTTMVSVFEAIGHLPPIDAGKWHDDLPNHRARMLSDLNLKRIASAKPGQSNVYMHTTEYGDLSLDCHRKVNTRIGHRCFSDVYTRMHPGRPSPTITTKCHSISNGRFGHFDVSQNRGISLREAAILQSFPENYIFYPEDKIESIARMIGNAVPPRLASFYASYLVRSINS